MTLQRADALPQPDIRTLEEIEQDILGRRQRVEGLEQKLPELRAARDAAAVMYHAAR